MAALFFSQVNLGRSVAAAAVAGGAPTGHTSGTPCARVAAGSLRKSGYASGPKPFVHREAARPRTSIWIQTLPVRFVPCVPSLFSAPEDRFRGGTRSARAPDPAGSSGGG
ncbi:hypothetical protein DI272_12640 [Streptomyces sp. Act143]|nr:hypothetical protein DI272_12640 [Streptomyces sp. Act143]